MFSHYTRSPIGDCPEANRNYKTASDLRPFLIKPLITRRDADYGGFVITGIFGVYSRRQQL
jgi:hypothetical protein